MKSNEKFSLRKWINKNIFPVATVSSVLVVIGVAMLVWQQIVRFENGILDVCATQQDGYVQLVLDQINIKSNRDDEEIVTDILASLDASSNKYWTFSRNEAMLFVKDVLETNKYHGFTTATYYVSDSAREFLDGLKLNKVTHKTISIGEKNYIASGVVFEYSGAEYKLCLLTNRSVFLDNNRFLGAKISLCVLFGIVAFLFLVTAMEMARKNSALVKDISNRMDTIAQLNSSVNRLNDRLNEKEVYDTRTSIMSEDMLGEFLVKLGKKKVAPLTFARLKCLNEKGKDRFFEKGQVLLDHTVLRFCLSSGEYLLIFVKGEYKTAMKLVNMLVDDDIEIKVVAECDETEYVEEFYEKFKKWGV